MVIDFEKCFSNIKYFCDQINSMENGDNTLCKIDYNDKDGYHILMTKKRFDFAKKKCPEIMDEYIIKSQISNNLRIVNNNISKNSSLISKLQSEIVNYTTLYYKQFITIFYEKFGDIIDQLIFIIRKIDVACSNACNAFQYRYYRPIIQNNDTSFINAKYVRHPIIERINDDFQYIGNDINLDCNGMLLYGINSSGKSSFMKSIGINIIMAQAGMFVASHDFIYFPFRHIFTRISGMDNIYKGLSSFTVEMTELRNIMQRCDRYSIVLGDEICNGTEIISALSIVSGSIDTLVQKKTSFIFATHLHDLIKINTVKQYIDKNIFVKHIHISFDHNGTIKYERVLRDGKGIDTYGLEVCKSLDMPINFMKSAENVRKEIDGLDIMLLKPIQSKYNKEVFMDICKICGNKAQDTHHIEYQSKSDNDGNFQNFHKNIKHNLVALCKSCHQKEHSGEISIKGYEKTSNGVVLNYEKNIVENDNKGDDISNDDIVHIKKYIKKGKISWFFRKNQTNVFKECSNIQKIQLHVSKLIGKTINLNTIEDFVFDPLY